MEFSGKICIYKIFLKRIKFDIFITNTLNNINQFNFIASKLLIIN